MERVQVHVDPEAVEEENPVTPAKELSVLSSSTPEIWATPAQFSPRKLYSLRDILSMPSLRMEGCDLGPDGQDGPSNPSENIREPANGGATGQAGHASGGATGQAGHASGGATGQAGHANEGAIGQAGHANEGAIGQAGHANEGAIGQAGHANEGANGQAGHANEGANGQAGHTNEGANGQAGHANEGANGEAGHANEKNGQAGLSNGGANGQAGHGDEGANGHAGHSNGRPNSEGEPAIGGANHQPAMGGGSNEYGQANRGGANGSNERGNGAAPLNGATHSQTNGRGNGNDNKDASLEPAELNQSVSPNVSHLAAPPNTPQILVEDYSNILVESPENAEVTVYEKTPAGKPTDFYRNGHASEFQEAPPVKDKCTGSCESADGTANISNETFTIEPALVVEEVIRSAHIASVTSAQCVVDMGPLDPARSATSTDERGTVNNVDVEAETVEIESPATIVATDVHRSQMGGEAFQSESETLFSREFDCEETVGGFLVRPCPSMRPYRKRFAQGCVCGFLVFSIIFLAIMIVISRMK